MAVCALSLSLTVGPFLYEPQKASTLATLTADEIGALSEALSISSDGDLLGAERFDPDRLARDLSALGISSRHIPEVEDIVETIAAEAQEDDVVLIMSNGAFGGIYGKLKAALEREASDDELKAILGEFEGFHASRHQLMRERMAEERNILGTRRFAQYVVFQQKFRRSLRGMQFGRGPASGE